MSANVWDMCDRCGDNYAQVCTYDESIKAYRGLCPACFAPVAAAREAEARDDECALAHTGTGTESYCRRCGAASAETIARLDGSRGS